MNKKQILSVVAGVVMLTACSEYDPSLSNTGAGNYTPADLQLMEKYTENFEARYGKIDENHTWGFGSAAQGAKTRTANPKGNMWEKEGWNVPPVITDEQKEIVRQYFQQNTPLGYTNPNWTNFWVQQVYKGGTNTEGSQTAEKYIVGNGDEVTGGDNMDHLASKDDNGEVDHINNFNNSNNNAWEGCMLMENSSTYSFGYNNSNGSVYHYDKAALVHWTVIRDWANANGLKGDCLNDGLNRSYMGFDWAQIDISSLYSANYDYANADYNVTPPILPIISYNTFEFEGNTYNYLMSNTNEYAYDKSEPNFHGKMNYNDKPSDDVIRDLLKYGYLPYSDTQKDWIKPATGADGYYSDWIVSLTEAKNSNTPDNPNSSDDPDRTWYRIMCEDLGSTNDFDFNDLVFDVSFTKNGENDYTAHVRVQAAGGTLPIYIQYKENDAYEAHHILGSDETNVPINVGPAGYEVNPYDFEEITIQMNSDNPNDIDIYVKERANTATEKIILLPKSGGYLSDAPQKICIKNGQNVCWMKESKQIEDVYEHFADWVRSEKGDYSLDGDTPWTSIKKNEHLLYKK